MGNISEIDHPVHLPVQIRVFSYLRDHVYESRAVFPAVESMQLLARAITESEAPADSRYMSNAAFGKFLAMDCQETAIDAFVELELIDTGGVQGRLMTRRRISGSKMSRVKEHARICFEKAGMGMNIPDVPDFGRNAPDTQVGAKAVYEELVPMGPAYQNIAGQVRLYPAGAAAEIRTPDLPAADGPLGSPFALDAAFHVACVWGQRYSGFIGFPVGFDSRRMVSPARHGQSYSARVVPTDRGRVENVFDLWICRPDGGLCEVVQGLHMRDVTGGKKRPPAWIQKNH